MGWAKRIGVAALVLGVAAAIPVARNELACMNQRETTANPYLPLLPQDQRRNLVDTFLTYPEWSIVHAYEDFAAVTRREGEHHFGYWSAITGYWSNLCKLSQVASKRGEITLDVKAMLYVIGVSFAAEMAVKGLYETTIGRFTAWLRGAEPTPDDAFAAKTAETYAAFLHQTPWYEFPFWPTLKAYWTHNEPGKPSIIRTVERRVALSLEYGVKAIYAKGMGMLAGAAPAKLTIETVVAGMPFTALEADKAVTIKATIPDGIVVETPRYRAYTEFLQRVAAAGGNIREIAGNDSIFVTVIGDGRKNVDLEGFVFRSEIPGSPGVERLARAALMFRVPLQAKPGAERFGLELPVPALASFMRAAPALGLTFEHAYDY
jgi:hypothetical protein